MKIVRYVGPKGCPDEKYRDAIKDEEHVVIDTLPKGANVVIRFTRNDHPVRVQLPPRHRDFLDLAAAVYVADELEPRADADDGWARTFEYLVTSGESIAMMDSSAVRNAVGGWSMRNASRYSSADWEATASPAPDSGNDVPDANGCCPSTETTKNRPADWSRDVVHHSGK